MTAEPAPDLEAIWREFSGKLRAFIRKRVADDHAADDILQDVFVKVHTRIDTLKDPARLAGWLHHIARNAIIDHYRAQKPPLEAPDAVAATDDLPSAEGGIDLSRTVREMVRSLPEPYRRALVLTEYQGLSQKELARRLRISFSGARSRVQRGREKLREMLLHCCHLEFDRRGSVIDCHPRRPCCDCSPGGGGSV